MTRSSYKVPFIAKSILPESRSKSSPGIKSSNYDFIEKAVTDDMNRAKIQIIYQRGSTIVPEMVGKVVKIHTGHKFVKLKITEHVIGYKFGEFATTKKRARYKKKKKTTKKGRKP